MLAASDLSEDLWSRCDVNGGIMCAATPKHVSEGRRLSPATPPKLVERLAEVPPRAFGKRRGNFSATPRVVKMHKTTVQMAEPTPDFVWWNNGEVRSDPACADISPRAESLQTEEELSSQVGGTPLSASEFPEISIASLYIIAEYVRLAADVTDTEVYLGSEYMVTVDRSRGDVLGLHVEADSETLLVEHVNPGLVHIWNELAAQNELDGNGRVADVRPGDCLVEVNGMRSVSDMVAELRKHQVLAMTFKVVEDPVLAAKFEVCEDRQPSVALESASASCNGCGRSDCESCESLWEALCSECWGTPY